MKYVKKDDNNRSAGPMMDTKRSVPLLLSLAIGVLVVAAMAAIICAVEMYSGVTILATAEERISNYLELMGVSFSVTFITTSLLGGLSDKSEKIYWLSYPENYLINAPLNFMVLSSVSYLCIGIQAAVTAMIILPETIRESLFLSSFVVGIIAIVVLSYKFTAVFFSRKKLVNKAEREFDRLISNENCKSELQRAVVGLFNNTLEAVSPEANNFDRVSENIKLLIKYESNATCSFWLRKLIVEIGRNNTSMLSQLILELEGTAGYDRFSHMLEYVVLNKDVPFDGQELLNTIYDIRLKGFKKKLGDQPLFVNGTADGEKVANWSAVARDLNILLTNIDTSKLDNCIFVLNELSELPFELLKDANCQNKIVDIWDSILKFLSISVNENDTIYYQQLEKPIIDFLTEHPAYYYDEEMFGCRYREQLSEILHKAAAGTIRKMEQDKVSYMIDVIENDTDRYRFLGWLTDCMAGGEVPKELWKTSKQADYRSEGKYFYARDFSNVVIGELISKRKKLKESYIERDKNSDNRYEYNVEILEYNHYISKYIRFLLHVKQYESIYCEHSIERFIKVLFNDPFVGEANSFTHAAYDPFCEDGDTEETVLNCYVNAFEMLIGEKDGLYEIRKAIELTDGNGAPVNNYFTPSDDEGKQKRAELLYFLGHIYKAVKGNRIDSDNEATLAAIITCVLTNPCVGPVSKDTADNPEEVNNCLNILRENETYRRETLKYIADVTAEEGLLDNMYTMVYNNESIGEKEEAELLKNVADEFDKCLQALGMALEN